MPLRFAAIRRLLAALSLVVLLPAVAGGDAGVVTEIPAAGFEDVDAALLDAIADEGIGAPTTSHFGAMLARTAADLGHRPDLYADARIHTFCNAAVAALLAAESAHNIALCPLSIAIYRVPERPLAVYLSYRGSADSAGGRAAEALLRRIVARTAAQFAAPADVRR